MGDGGDKALPLRGPSLPGSLGVSVRGHWETSEGVNAGIDMRSGDCTDMNVQLDFMKESDSNELNRSNTGAYGQDIAFGTYDQIDSVKEQGNCQPNVGTWETFDEENTAIKRGYETKNHLDLTRVNIAELQERDIDETGRKYTLSNVGPRLTGSANAYQLSHEAREEIPPQSQESDDFSLNELFYERRNASQNNTLPLPAGKKYHVFFSYDMADRNWVHSLVERMETEYGYKCSFHERDFHGGKRVLENIDDHIKWAVKTVLVLSPDFLESSWCQYEMKQGLHSSIEEARMLIVPVMVRECEVPDTLRSLTYIDATPGTDWWGRFLEAVAAQETLQVCNAAGNQIAIQPRYENFDVLCEISSKFHCCFGESLEVPYVPEELNKPGIQVSRAEFDMAMSTLSKALDTNWINRCLCDYIPCCAALMTVICGLSLIFIGVGIVMTLATQPLVMTGRLLITLSVPTAVIYGAVFFAQLRWRKTRIRKCVCEVNQRLSASRIIMDVKLSTIGHCSSIHATITFRYYDFQPCMNYLKDLTSREEQTFGANNFSGDEEQVAIPKLEQYIQEYGDGGLKLLIASGPRHVGHAKCLCQYIEDTP